MLQPEPKIGILRSKKVTSRRRCEPCGHIGPAWLRERARPCRLRSSLFRKRSRHVQLHVSGAAQHARRRWRCGRWLYRSRVFDYGIGGKAEYQCVLREQACCDWHHEGCGKRRSKVWHPSQRYRAVGTFSSRRRYFFFASARCFVFRTVEDGTEGFP